MFKKIIYSFMALSLTMLPATEVMAVDINTTTFPDGYNLTTGNEVDLNGSTDTWTGATITNTGGTLTITGITQGVVSTPNYIQTTGSGELTILPSETAIGKFTLQGGSATSKATVSSGTINVGSTVSTNLTGNELVLGNYSSVESGAKLDIAAGNKLTVNGTGASLVISNNDTWDGKVTLSNGEININGTVTTENTGAATTTYGEYSQTAGTLNVNNGANLTFAGNDTKQQNISGGNLNVGTNGSGTLNLGMGSYVDSAVTVNIGENGTLNIRGQRGNADNTITINSGDTWNGKITMDKEVGGRAYLKLSGYDNSAATPSTNTAVYQQIDGTLDVADNSNLWIKANKDVTKVDDYGDTYAATNSYMKGGVAHVRSGSSLNIAADTTDTTGRATLNDDVNTRLYEGSKMTVSGSGTAILNDIISTKTGSGANEDDVWQGQVIVDTDSDTPGNLRLENVGINFSNGTLAKDETVTTPAVFVQKGGTTIVTSNNNGGSEITINNAYGVNNDTTPTTYYNSPTATGATGTPNYHNGIIAVSGQSEDLASTLTINYLDDYTTDNALGFMTGTSATAGVTGKQNLVMAGNGNIVLNTNGKEVDYIYGTITNPDGSISYTDNRLIYGANANNNLTVNGNGALVLYNASENGVDIGSNVTVNNSDMYVIADKAKIGIYASDSETDDVATNYGSLTLNNSNYHTFATQNNIVGDLTLNDSWMYFYNPSVNTVGGNLTTGSGIDMMNSRDPNTNLFTNNFDKITVAGNTTINDLELKIDVNPTTLQTDNIHTLGNVYENGTLNLSDYDISTTDLRRGFYRFNVLTSDGTYSRGAGARKIVTGRARRIISTKIGDYQMYASQANGAFDLMLTRFNPQVFRGQVALDVLYANQQVINNQLYDRMVYSILPYFNAKCANKTASADTLYSPYQYSMTDPGIWFKPYANFETIHMNYGLTKVRNNAYGAMVGADFKKAEWGNWTFIPTAYIGYNGGRTTYSGVGMWHNGGQLGLMGTLTNGDFVTMLNVYGGGYHNSMDIGGYHDKNALWNAGVGSKTAYNIHLPWDFILQPTLYMSYNYVGGSKWNSNYDGFTHKLDALNAYTVAPGLNLIWQKETFSIYALFQAMFNVGSTVSGRVAEIDLPHVGIKDPYFEYGLGASKYFLDRFSGYGQVTARSGSRKGVGFQLGLNVRI